MIKLSPTLEPQDLTNWKLDIAGEINVLQDIFNGIGQVFFLDNTISRHLILSLLSFWAGKSWDFMQLIGNIVSIIIAYFLGGEHTLIAMGLYGYNAILTIIAVSAVFNSEHNRFALLSGIIAACLTVPTRQDLAHVFYHMDSLP